MTTKPEVMHSSDCERKFWLFSMYRILVGTVLYYARRVVNMLDDGPLISLGTMI